MVETGESRTPQSITKTVSNFESDPTQLLPQLLDQLIALGQTAQQLRHTLGSNGHHQDQVEELIQRISQGGKHAP